MDIFGPAFLGSVAVLAAESPARKLPEVRRVSQGGSTSGTASDARQRPQQDVAAAEARDIVALRREMQRRDLPAGPPPAFELSVLEMEGDLKQVLARIEANRALAREGASVQPDVSDAGSPPRLTPAPQSSPDALPPGRPA